jgi:hypothetical protein
MILLHELLLFKYAQGQVLYKTFLETAFLKMNLSFRKEFLQEIIKRIFDYELEKKDVETAIKASELNDSLEAVRMLRSGLTIFQLEQMIKLPEAELECSFKLLINLFKTAYLRKYEVEKSNPKSWHYWDLSDPREILSIMSKIDPKDLPRVTSRKKS